MTIETRTAGAETANLAVAKYDAMIAAIAECHRVDELKDMSDKALALEIYAKQARNQEAERKACDIRIRAERRCGELLKDLERYQGGDRKSAEAKSTSSDGKLISQYAQALTTSGLSPQRAHRMQALANVPAEQFEQALSGPEKVTVTKLIEKAKAADEIPQIDKTALMFWGFLRDFERHGFFDVELDPVTETMTDTMRADVQRLVPLIADYFAALAGRNVECV